MNSFNELDRLSVIVNGNNLNDRNFNPGNMHAGMLPGNGLANSWSSAVNYNMEDKKRLKIDASYDVADTRTENNTSTFRQTFLPDTTWFYNQQNKTTNHTINHMFNTRINYKIDESQSLLITPQLAYSKSDNIQNNIYETLNKNKDTNISGQSFNTSQQIAPTINIHGLYRKRFKKQGQTFSVDLSIDNNNTSGNNTFQTKDQYLVLDSVASYNRLTVNHNNNNNTRLRISYTTALSQDRFLQLFYTWNNQQNKITNNTYDIDSLPGKYEHPNDSLSNIAKNKSTSQLAGINLRTNKKNYDYTLGFNTQLNSTNNENSHVPSFRKKFINLFPSAHLNIRLSKGKNLRFNYEGSSTNPSAQQLQPLPNMANSLLVQDGNPDLKPSFRHSVSLGYNAMNRTIFRGLFMGLSTEIIRNKIVNINRYDSTGHQYTIPVNANGATGLNGFVTNSLPIKSIHSSLNLSTGISYNKDITFTIIDKENIKSYTHIINFNETANFKYRYKSLLELSTILQLIYRGSRYGILSTNTTNYLTYNLFFNYNIYLLAGFLLGNDIRYIMNRGRTEGYNTNIALLNGFVAKSIFKQKQGLIKIYGYDLLHQNVNISRNMEIIYRRHKPNCIKALFYVKFYMVL